MHKRCVKESPKCTEFVVKLWKFCTGCLKNLTSCTATNFSTLYMKHDTQKRKYTDQTVIESM